MIDNKFASHLKKEFDDKYRRMTIKEYLIKKYVENAKSEDELSKCELDEQFETDMEEGFLSIMAEKIILKEWHNEQFKRLKHEYDLEYGHLYSILGKDANNYIQRKRECNSCYNELKRKNISKKYKRKLEIDINRYNICIVNVSEKVKNEADKFGIKLGKIRGEHEAAKFLLLGRQKDEKIHLGLYHKQEIKKKLKKLGTKDKNSSNKIVHIKNYFKQSQLNLDSNANAVRQSTTDNIVYIFEHEERKNTLDNSKEVLNTVVEQNTNLEASQDMETRE